jgi:hypothetical protein
VFTGTECTNIHKNAGLQVSNSLRTNVPASFISRANIVLSRKQGLLNTINYNKYLQNIDTTISCFSQGCKLTFLPLTAAHAQTRAHHAPQTQGTWTYLLPTHGLSLLAEVAAGHHKAVLPDETVVGARAPAAQTPSLAETFKHFIFHDPYTSMCGPAFAQIYRGAKEMCAKVPRKEMQCGEKETWNRITFTDSLYTQFPSKLSLGTGLIQQHAPPNVKFTIQVTKPRICAKVRNRAFVQRSLLCSEDYLPRVKAQALQVCVCASPPKFNPESLSWRAAAALVWMRNHEQQT